MHSNFQVSPHGDLVIGAGGMSGDNYQGGGRGVVLRYGRATRSVQANKVIFSILLVGCDKYQVA